MRFSKKLYEQILQLLREQGYSIRFEKGNFQFGYCLVKNRKIIIINRFFKSDARMNCLLELLPELEINEGLFSNTSREVYAKVDGKLVEQKLLQSS